MLRWRLTFGAAFIGLLVGLFWVDHQLRPRGIVLLLLALWLGVAAGGEMRALLASRGRSPLAGVTYLGIVLLILSAADPILPGWILMPRFGLTLMLVLLVVFVVEICRYEAGGVATERVAAGALAILYVGGGLATAVWLRTLAPEADHDWGLFALGTSIAVIKMGDVGAYTVGRLIGRHKLAPQLSPGKTWEGFGGAILFSSLAAALAIYGIGPRCGFPLQQVTLAWTLAFAVTVSIAGILADLAESLLKRDAGAKDSSQWMPGFGGILDLLDSALLALPVALLFWEAFGREIRG